jgi:hypothetical protein
MKKYLLTFGLVTFLAFSSIANATADPLIDATEETAETINTTADITQEELIEPGLLPDHPLYFLKTLSENIQTLLTFGEANRVNQHMMLAEKRLAEAQALIAQGETELAEKATNRYQEQSTHAFTFAQQAKEKGQDSDEVMAKIAENTLRHQAVLSRVYEQVPEEAKPAIEQAMENSLRGHEQALQSISQEKSEKVDQILERIEEKRPAIEEEIKQLQEQGVPIQNLSPRGQSQDESDKNLLEINQANQEQAAKEIQTRDNQAEGQGAPTKTQEQTQERAPAANQQ